MNMLFWGKASPRALKVLFFVVFAFLGYLERGNVVDFRIVDFRCFLFRTAATLRGLRHVEPAA